MDLHDALNLQRVYWTLAAQWGCPVWRVDQIIRQAIAQSWEKTESDPQAMALWLKYFPSGKPTPKQYILLLGHAHEQREDIPPLLF